MEEHGFYLIGCSYPAFLRYCPWMRWPKINWRRRELMCSEMKQSVKLVWLLKHFLSFLMKWTQKSESKSFDDTFLTVASGRVYICRVRGVASNFFEGGWSPGAESCQLDVIWNYFWVPELFFLHNHNYSFFFWMNLHHILEMSIFLCSWQANFFALRFLSIYMSEPIN